MSAFGSLLAQALRDTARSLPTLVNPVERRDRRLDACTTIGELRNLARRKVPGVVFDFVDGAANDERTLRANQDDLATIQIMPRALVDVSRVSTETSILGSLADVPLIGAPTGLTGLAHHDGERGLALAAHRAGAVYVLSAMASYTIEEVREATAGPLWFQVYAWRDRGFVRSLVDRARAAGCLALVLTVDVPVAGARERDRRNGFGIPPRMTPRSLGQGITHPGWSRDFVRRPRITVANASGIQSAGDSVSLLEYINTQFDPTLTWTDVAWLRDLWDGPLVIKGLLRPADAAHAVDVGANAVIVSNHGGRQLDGAPSSISALPGVVDAVDGRAEVYVDGGLRRGSDVVKALALGANACLAGRPFVYGLAAGGTSGAHRSWDILCAEMRLAMALTGTPSVADIDIDCVAEDHSDGLRIRR